MDSYSNYRVSTNNLSSVYSRENYVSSAPQVREPPVQIFISDFWDISHIIASTYDPHTLGPNKVETGSMSFMCFYEALAVIIPNSSLRTMIKDFISMTLSVQSTLINCKELKSFFKVHTDLKLDSGFFKRSFVDADSLSMWVYLLHSYYDIQNRIDIRTFNTVKTKYNKNTISKPAWAHPLWAIIHYSAYYSSSILQVPWKQAYKAFMSCLRYSMPCPICRNHLEENLSNINIDQYLHSNTSIFEFTVILHNTVNKSNNKPLYGVDEARKIYGLYDQPLVQQNIGYNSHNSGTLY